MAEREAFGLGPRLDIQQLQLEAQHRWLRPAEICEILRNYQMFQITPEPPNRPPSGSLFLFDRKVLRYFRKDAHSWRKKRDGKTVKEAHEKLKVGSVDALHCYYAHGEDNENFQRRCYWMLEPDMMHIVFVHYLDVKGNKTNSGGNRDSDEVSTDSRNGSSPTSSFPANNSTAPSRSTDSISATSTLASLCEDADSEVIHQASSRVNAFHESPHVGNGYLMGSRMDAGMLNSYILRPYLDDTGGSSIPVINDMSHFQGDKSRGIDDSTFAIDGHKRNDNASWDQLLEQYNPEFNTEPSYTHSNSTGKIPEEQYTVLADRLGNNTTCEKVGNSQPIQSNWQIPFEEDLVHLPNWSMAQSLSLDLRSDLATGYHDASFEIPTEMFTLTGQRNEQPMQENIPKQITNAQFQCSPEANSKNEIPVEESINFALTAKRALLDGEESLKKVDSFSRWVSKELGEVDDLQMQSSSGISWSTVESGNIIDDSSLSPSLSQDQLFSITDFSPKWAYAELETEVLITGTFLKSQQEVVNYNWSCMFGEVEVTAEVLADGIFCCHAPPHKVGRVPFYVTCSNRLACSEVREFDYHHASTESINITDVYSSLTSEMLLHLRLEQLLSLKSVHTSDHTFKGDVEKKNLISKIITLKEEEEYSEEEESTQEMPLPQNKVKEHLFLKHLKQKLYSWLLHKVSEDGKGPTVLDEDGQGVLHLAAALGYDWAITATVTAGVSINFRDVNGWTALHWAAFSGREQTVAILVSHGAAPGALTDPSPEFPLGRTPADLASGNGHKGISGFLAESSLTSHLSSLTMDDWKEDYDREALGMKAVPTVSERTATPVIYGDVPDGLSLKDSLTAVCNATQAADRIQQVFRMQSFQRKQLTQCGDDEFGLSDPHALSLLTSKKTRAGQGNGLAHAAALHIQKKFRGWKKRKEFLFIRQRIVKIQAHVRGHQVRKQYKSIIWSVGILEKIILRWRRKGSGLRGFRPDILNKDPSQQNISKEDDYDFLKEGRKQTEERLQKALSRVKSMVQYPEARAQYRRLLNVVEGCRETKVSNMDLINSEETVDGMEDLIDIDMLLDDDNFMPIAFD
ncbi:Calmodulin-binding transcription activator 2 [Quillaja saponaria]|uniref:Calmodulin-binding transcription activator 2 n=1 Tax=Quillaja saponaria TaxID=32244 RepID=A0AAD7P953_QUISA|nr:Calmodulin-binding transcription activator 2 [Quillaja saponaria]